MSAFVNKTIHSLYSIVDSFFVLLRMNKNLKRLLYGLLVVVIVFIAAYPKLDLGEKEPEASPVASRQPSVLTVDAKKVAHEKLDYAVNVTGTVVADESVDLNAEVSGKVETIRFQEGQEVKQGQILVRLNADELEAELVKLRFTQKLNEDNEFRQRKLLEKEAISREEYEIALTTLNTSEAEIKLLETRLAKHTVRAPFSGKIGLREVSVGSYLNPGTRIARIYKIDPIKIDFAIPGRYLEDINVGDKLKFTVDAYDEVFDGIIYALEPQIDLQSRSIKLRAQSPNQDKKLLPGQFAKIELILDEIDDAILVPAIAVIPELNQTKVYVLDGEEVAVRIVKTGIRTADEVQVIEGLEPGDIVITSGLLQIRPGMKVNVSI